MSKKTKPKKVPLDEVVPAIFDGKKLYSRSFIKILASGLILSLYHKTGSFCLSSSILSSNETKELDKDPNTHLVRNPLPIRDWSYFEPYFVTLHVDPREQQFLQVYNLTTRETSKLELWTESDIKPFANMVMTNADGIWLITYHNFYKFEYIINTKRPPRQLEIKHGITIPRPRLSRMSNNHMLLCGIRQFELWDVLLKKLLLTGETSRDTNGILISELHEKTVVTCEAEIMRIWTVGRKEPIDVELDIAASCVKIARNDLIIVGDYKNRVGIYDLRTGDILQDLTGERQFDLYGLPGPSGPILSASQMVVIPDRSQVADATSKETVSFDSPSTKKHGGSLLSRTKRANSFGNKSDLNSSSIGNNISSFEEPRRDFPTTRNSSTSLTDVSQSSASTASTSTTQSGEGKEPGKSLLEVYSTKINGLALEGDFVLFLADSMSELWEFNKTEKAYEKSGELTDMPLTQARCLNEKGFVAIGDKRGQLFVLYWPQSIGKIVKASKRGRFGSLSRSASGTPAAVKAALEAVEPLDEEFVQAAFNGEYYVVAEMLEKAPHLINRLNSRQQSALYCACYNGHDFIVDLLLSFPDVNLNIVSNGSSPLHAASWSGHVKIVDMLLKAGARADVLNKHGELAHHNARQDTVKAALASSTPLRKPKQRNILRILEGEARISEAQFQLALFYQNGSKIVKTNIDMANDFIKKAASRGHAECQFRYAMDWLKYEDFSNAFDWLRAASEGGHALATHNLAILFLRGVGAPRDFERGTHLLKIYINIVSAATPSTQSSRELIRTKSKGNLLHGINLSGGIKALVGSEDLKAGKESPKDSVAQQALIGSHPSLNSFMFFLADNARKSVLYKGDAIMTAVVDKLCVTRGWNPKNFKASFMDGREIPSLDVTMESLGVREIKFLPFDPKEKEKEVIKELREQLKDQLLGSPPKDAKETDRRKSATKAKK